MMSELSFFVYGGGGWRAERRRHTRSSPREFSEDLDFFS